MTLLRSDELNKPKKSIKTKFFPTFLGNLKISVQDFLDLDINNDDDIRAFITKAFPYDKKNIDFFNAINRFCIEFVSIALKEIELSEDQKSQLISKAQQLYEKLKDSDSYKFDESEEKKHFNDLGKEEKEQLDTFMILDEEQLPEALFRLINIESYQKGQNFSDLSNFLNDNKDIKEKILKNGIKKTGEPIDIFYNEIGTNSDNISIKSYCLKIPNTNFEIILNGENCKINIYLPSIENREKEGVLTRNISKQTFGIILSSLLSKKDYYLSEGEKGYQDEQSLVGTLKSSKIRGKELFIKALKEKNPDIDSKLTQLTPGKLKSQYLSLFSSSFMSQVANTFDSIPQTNEQILNRIILACYYYLDETGNDKSLNENDLMLFVMYCLMEHPASYEKLFGSTSEGNLAWVFSSDIEKGGKTRELQKKLAKLIDDIKKERVNGYIFELQEVIKEEAQKKLLLPISGREVFVAHNTKTDFLSGDYKPKSISSAELLNTVEKVLGSSKEKFPLLDLMEKEFYVTSPIESVDEINQLKDEDFEVTPDAYFHLTTVMGKEMANIFSPILDHLQKKGGDQTLRSLLNSTGIIIPEKKSTISFAFILNLRGFDNNSVGTAVKEQITKLAEGDLGKLEELKKYIEGDNFLKNIKINNITLLQYLTQEILSFIQLVIHHDKEGNNFLIAKKVKEMLGQWIHLATDENIHTELRVNLGLDILDPERLQFFHNMNIRKVGFETHPVRIADLQGNEKRWSVETKISQSGKQSQGFGYGNGAAFEESRQTRIKSREILELSTDIGDNGTREGFNFQIMEDFANRPYTLVEDNGEFILIP